MQPNQPPCLTDVQRVLTRLFEGDPQAKRVLSLANVTVGVIRTAALAVHTIGQIDAALRHWVPYVAGSRTSIDVAMDWTDFDADGRATLMLSLPTRHGRATPLLWLTVATAASRAIATNTNTRRWSVSPTPWPPTSRFASSPIVASAIRNSIGC